jgi:hypothetical protein
MPISKKPASQKFSVDLILKSFDIAKAGAGVTVTVRDRSGLLLGTIEIGQGTLGWKGAKKQKFKRFPWDTLAQKLEGA